VMRIAFRIATISTWLQIRLLATISPGTVSVAEPMFRRIKPAREETLTPAEAFKRHGVPTPAELDAKRHAGATPTDVTPSATGA
jgi:hypothetical protein